MSAAGLAPETRRAVEQFVRPLYAGLDGVQTFDRVERIEKRVARLRGDDPRPVDGALLELLLLLHGAVERVGSLAAGGRLELFLKTLGLPEELVRRARASLQRLAEEPRGVEEELVHDALLLEGAGVAAAVARLMAAGKKRLPLPRALALLDPGPPPERFRTRRGAALAAERRAAAEEWIQGLRTVVQREVE